MAVSKETKGMQQLCKTMMGISIRLLLLYWLVLPNKKIPVHYHFVFSNENMINYDVIRVGMEPNIVMAEQIRTINKTRKSNYQN